MAGQVQHLVGIETLHETVATVYTLTVPDDDRVDQQCQKSGLVGRIVLLQKRRGVVVADGRVAGTLREGSRRHGKRESCKPHVDVRAAA